MYNISARENIFATPKKTYILGITKKGSKNDVQDFPVFTYLVSNIGETLDVKRFEIEGKSDLEKAKELFNSYKGSPKTFPVEEVVDLRCKLHLIEKFEEEINNHWCVDRWWSKEEKINLGIAEEERVVSFDEFKEMLNDFATKIKEYKKSLDEF